MTMQDDWTEYIENTLLGDDPDEAYLWFQMPVEDYIQYDDPDLYPNWEDESYE